MIGLREFLLMKWDLRGTMKLWMPEQACSTARMISWPCQRSSFAFLYVQCSQFYWRMHTITKALIAGSIQNNILLSMFCWWSLIYTIFLQKLKSSWYWGFTCGIWHMEHTSPHFRQHAGRGIPIRWHRVLLLPEYRVAGGGPVIILQAKPVQCRNI